MYEADALAIYTDNAVNMVIIKDKTSGATDYTLTVIESAKRIMEYKRMINRIRKARAEKEAA